MTELTAERFTEFFTAVHGFPPFPWQSRLVHVLFSTEGRWPELLDLPTASGKTAAVEIALYTLAAGLPVPRRIIFVVDRRAIVQQGARLARRIRDRLDDVDARDRYPILTEVRDGLLACQGARGRHRDPIPFAVAELRGAVQEDPAWTERPDLPVVAASTVDQIGSRLLFRGYGISRRMLPVHAGLVGNDALLLLDEVHLSQPFAQLLRRITERYRPSELLPDRWQVVELSATPATSHTERFTLDEMDAVNPVLAQRTTAVKPVQVLTVKAPADPRKAEKILVSAHVEQVRKLLDGGHVRSIGVIVNRVPRAIEISRHLRDAIEDDIDVKLVTGRMRSLDRDTTVTEIINRVGSQPSADSAEQSSATGRLVVVATQTIEAGADLDFDVIVTDVASLDALIQRFGRVDRMGRFSAVLTEAGTDIADRPHSIIVGTNQISKAPDDPIYGESLTRTWEWLTDQPEPIDFGIRNHTALFPDDEQQRLTSHRAEGPALLRPHLDRLVRTSPIPDADVDVTAFLHGLDSRPDQDVEVVWRADLTPTMLHTADANADTDGNGSLGDLIAAVPPSPGEALSVLVSQVRQWLTIQSSGGSADLTLSDMESPARQQDQVKGGQFRPCLVWRDRKATIVRTSRGLQPGDSIIVPAVYGGITNGNWDPASTTPVDDLAQDAGLPVGRFRMRLHPTVIEQVLFGLEVPGDKPMAQLSEQERFAARRFWLKTGTFDTAGILVQRGVIPTPAWTDLAEADPLQEIADWIRENLKEPSADCGDFDTEWVRIAAGLGDPAKLHTRNVQIVPSEFGPLYVVSVKIPAEHTGSSNDIDIDTDPTASQNSGHRYPLDDHLRDVERWVLATTEHLGLPNRIRATLARAGAVHDIGKADERAQLYLSEGALVPELLAKSAIPSNDRARDHSARSQSGYPRGIRHELASVAMLPTDTEPEIDTALLRYLIGSHHGYGRPFHSPQIDPDNLAVEYTWRDRLLRSEDPYHHATIGGPLSTDFNDVITRFGVFGAAWLEAILRLADHCASNEAARIQES